MIKYEVGQEWQLVNGETVTITEIAEDGVLGSDMVWRDFKGFAYHQNSKEFDFSEIVMDVADHAMETSDFSFRLHDSEIKDILARLKNNGYFDVLEFGKQVSLATTHKLKEIL